MNIHIFIKKSGEDIQLIFECLPEVLQRPRQRSCAGGQPSHSLPPSDHLVQLLVLEVPAGRGVGDPVAIKGSKLHPV